jgi:hypothetical protein
MSLPESPVETVTVRDPVVVDLDAKVDHEALIKIVTDLVSQKPTSVADALKLMGTLQEKIGEWVLSEVPDKDKILAGLKTAQTMAASVGCLPCFKQ